jgi:UDP-2,3-diacylglucosamine pyrophosphatase LpxH
MANGRLYFLGDIHADFVWLSFAIDQNKIKDATIIQVGDFGLGFLKKEEELLTNLNNVCVLNNVMLYAIRGNHDDPSAFNSGNRFSNLKFLKDYTVLEIYGLNILFVGGSISIDRLQRAENGNYWKDETFLFDEGILSKVLKSAMIIDIVVTHSAPLGVYPFDLDPIVVGFLRIDEDLKMDILTDRHDHARFMHYLIELGLKPWFWYYGHFHKSHWQMYNEISFKLLNINEIHQHIT